VGDRRDNELPQLIEEEVFIGVQPFAGQQVAAQPPARLDVGAGPVRVLMPGTGQVLPGPALRMLAGCSATMSEPGCACSSRNLTRIQRRCPVRVRAKAAGELAALQPERQMTPVRRGGFGPGPHPR
jgi:hypothetical protein